MTKREVCRTQFSLDKVLEKLKALNISTVKLGKLSTLKDNGFSISAPSSHGNPLHLDPEVAKNNGSRMLK